MRDLAGAVVVITGASSGIGRATALRFARRGARVVLAARDGDALRTVCRHVEALGGEAEPVPTDVRDEAAVDRLAQRAVERFGRIDVWVNGAAVMSMGSFEETPSALWRAVIVTNLIGAAHGCRAALRRFGEQGRGTLINVASVAAEVPMPHASAYSVSKAGIRALSRCLRQEVQLLGRRDVHVVTILPPSVDTPIFQHAANHTGREVLPIPPVLRAEAVARRIVRAARRPRPEVFVGFGTRRLARAAARHPRVAERRMAARAGRDQLGVRPVPEHEGNVRRPAEPHAISGGWRWRPPVGAIVAATGAAILALAGVVAGGTAWRPPPPRPPLVSPREPDVRRREDSDLPEEIPVPSPS